MAKKIYLAGPILGLTYEDAQDWRNDFTNRIDQRIECFSPLRGKDYLKMRGPLEGSYAEFPLSTDRGITSRDRNDCMGADLVVFNMLGAKRVSIGTVIELGWADAARVPSILIMEKENAVAGKENVHEHPMVRDIISFRVDNVEDAIAIAEIVLLHKANPKRKSLDVSPIKYPTMFGGVVSADASTHTASGYTVLERRKPSALFDRRTSPSWLNTRQVWERDHCLYTETNRNKYTGDRRKANWVYYAHDFGKIHGAPPNIYRVCTRCGLSDAYIREADGPQHCSVKP